jgi:hypothetical protein
MSVGKFLRSGGWAAMSVALAAFVLPTDASAQGRNRAERMTQEREGGDRADVGQRNAMEIRGQRVQQANAARARQAEQRAAEQPIRQPVNRAAEQAANQGNRQARREGGQRNEQTTAQVLQRNDQEGRQTAQRTWQSQPGERNRSYADRERNRSYDGRNGGRGDDDRRDGDRNGNWQNNRRDYDRDRSDTNWQSGRRDSALNSRSWDRRWRNNDRYDWQRYRNANRSAFYIGTYYAPYRSYSYRRYGIGSYIGSPFYGNRYWITNPWQYRLPDVWGPYRWVRYYDDVLLVDIYSGQVVDVIHNFFW